MSEPKTQLDREDDLAVEERAVQKAFRRIVAFLFILFVFSFLDRTNIGLAALSMNKDLKLTATMYGFATTIFYAGYALCEIPSNVLLTRFGARKWISRILITWGIASTSTMFTRNATSLYIVRLLVGIAEAGFLPGILLYLTFWFSPAYRARAIGMFMMAQPATIALGASISGIILQHAHGWFGLAGWRWLFLIEGLPSVILGVVTYNYLSDSPAMAKWLTDEERSALLRRLEQEENKSPACQSVSSTPWQEVFSWNVIILSLCYFCMVVGLNANATWTPQIVREVLKTHNFAYVGVVTAIPAMFALISMPLWGAHSDRQMERSWHFALPVFLSALGWVAVAVLRAPELRMAGLTLSVAGVFAGQVIFWTVPPNVLSLRGRPVGIAWINTCGIVSASISPLLFGYLKDLTNGWFASLMFTAGMLVIAAVLVFLVSVNRKPELVSSR